MGRANGSSTCQILKAAISWKAPVAAKVKSEVPMPAPDPTVGGTIWTSTPFSRADNHAFISGSKITVTICSARAEQGSTARTCESGTSSKGRWALVIGKLNWLSRNAAFLLALHDSGVRFVAVDMPEANDLIVGIIALVAEAERDSISRRTKEALAVARARGVKLGNPNGAEALRRAGKGGVALRAAVAANAAAFAADLVPVLADISAAGHMSLREVAAELTACGIRTRRGGVWGVGNVKGLLLRSDKPDR